MEPYQEKRNKVGVYICHCGKNIAGVVDIERLKKRVEKIPDVEIIEDYKFMCSKTGQNLIAEGLIGKNIDRVVVAACSPRMHEPTFRRVLSKNGVNEFLFEQANIREQSSWVSMNDPEGALNIATDHINMAVAKVQNNKSLYKQTFPVTQEAMVIGGGISGMFAALDLANSYKTYLVERTPTIGGHMAQLDKTFPTMDCSACITTPKMVDIAQHENIELMTYSEVEDVDLIPGNYEVTVRRKSRFINAETCTGCGSCAQVCPITTGNEFDQDMKHRGAAYIPFPQAIPGIYTIDKDTCIKCGLCSDACEVKAIDLNLEDTIEKIKVGTIILATGNDIYDPSPEERYGYNRYKNVIIGLEMERLLSSTGPTLGKVMRPSDMKEPHKVAFVQCVGSRNFRDPKQHKYCSRVCCMYAMKQARQFKEKHPDSEVYIIYIDIRAFGKGYEEFYEIAGREYGINFIRGRVGEVSQKPDGGLIVRGTDTLLAEKYRLDVDMLILSSGIEARADTVEFGKLFGVQTTEDGMFMEAHPKLRPVDSLSDGIFFAGTCQAPRDIPDSVAQAKAAASSAHNFMAKGEVEVDPYYSYVREELCSGCRSCISLCPYTAIKFNEETMKSEISPVKCKGCGTCVSSCPSNAIVQNHFSKAQIMNEIRSLTCNSVEGYVD